MMSDYLDLRTLADEWRDLLDEDENVIAEGDGGDPEAADAFMQLLFDLTGSEGGPDDLRHLGDRYEPVMIAEGAFEDYARQLAEDIGAIDPNAAWPLGCIDWRRAASELAMDYTSVTYADDDYLIRSW